MTAALALTFGLGLFLVFDSLTRRPRAVPVARARLNGAGRVAEMLAAAGVAASPRQFCVACSTAGFGAGVLVALVLGSATIAMVAVVAGAYAPVGYVRARRRTRQRAFQQCWPDALDLLAGAARAGETLPGALAVVAERGPEPLRPAFRSVVADHRVSGDLHGALDRFRDGLADPIADRVAASLTVAHRVGGRDLVRVLRTLATFVRADVGLRREIEARQSWTVVAARAAAAAPWLVLVLLSTRSQALAAYNSATGVIVLAIGALASGLGYRMMVAVGRLPDEPRVLGGVPA